MAYLRHWFNGQAITIFHLQGGETIGRDPACAIHIDDPTISACHARISATQQGFLVQDLDSTNGLVSLGKKVPHCDLKDGKTFALGTHEFEFLHALPSELEKTSKIRKSWIPGIYFARQTE